MSILNNSLLLGAPAGGAAAYQISRSIRLNAPDSAYLSRTPSTAGNRKTWTWAGWVKRSGLGNTYNSIFSAGPNNSSGNPTNLVSIAFTDVDTIEFVAWGASTPLGNIKTSQVFRDASAWYHIVATMDTDNVTASDRIRLYVNGSRVTALSTATYPSQGSQFDVNNTQPHGIGRYVWSLDQHLSGYLADIHFIDGQALDPSSFTEVSATTGRLEPKAYSGPTPTGNSFWLPFSDNSAATATTLGKDNFNLGNNWTPNNLSVTAGAGNDSLVDTPTSGSQVDTGLGGQVTGNYCTLNPLDTGTATLTNGNLQVAYANTAYFSTRSTVGLSSGKWYWEVTVDSSVVANSIGTAARPIVGVMKAGASLSNYVGADANGWGYIFDGVKITNGSAGSYGSSFTGGDVIGVALDLDAGTLAFYKNNVSQGQAYGSLSGTFFPATTGGKFSSGNTDVIFHFNAGQRPFAYTAPSGFKALCDTNLPEGTITTSDTFTGNANADGPFVWLNGVPTTMTINSNTVTFGTHADKLANGFKLRTSSTSYNTSGSNTYSITTTGAKFKYARAQSNP